MFLNSTPLSYGFLFLALFSFFTGCASTPEAPPEPPPPLLEPEYVMSKIELLSSEEGFDLDGDGTPNNALALLFEDPMIGPVLGGDPNEYIAKSIRRANLLLLLDFHDFNDFQQDDSVDIDIYLGSDPDDERSNNFDGTPLTVTCSSLDEDGNADSQFNNATLQDGILQGEDGTFRFLVSFSNTEVLLQGAHIHAVFDPETQQITQGSIGGAVTFEDLEEVVKNDPEIGPTFEQVMLVFLEANLDTDLDGDGDPDALSASFRFEAVSTLIDLDTPCSD